MIGKAGLFAIMFTSLLIIGGSQAAFGAQLNTFINPDKPSSEFSMRYQKTVFIEYPEGGALAEALRGTADTVTIKASTPDPAINELRDRLNQKIASDGSGTQIADLTVTYTATMTGRPVATSFDLQVLLEGTLEGYTIRARQGQAPALVDLGWRGMTVQGPVIVNGENINQPIAAIEQMAPEIAETLTNSGAGQILSEPIINAEGIKNQPMTNWHFLFDPTGINVDASQFGLASDIAGFVVSGFTMGESSLREGRQVERVQEVEFSIDRPYAVRTVQSADVGNLHIIGFAALDSLEGLEIAGVTPTPPEGFATTSTGEFPVMIIYGMAAMAAIGGGAFFMFSNRALKKEQGMGQTGIDPSRLTGYQTSASAGGYQTNRGEAQLTDAADYAQTRSVYDDQPQYQSPPPAAPAESEATCGCATSVEMGSECDCAMQGSCLCDATCNCNADVCKEHVSSMK